MKRVSGEQLIHFHYIVYALDAVSEENSNNIRNACIKILSTRL